MKTLVRLSCTLALVVGTGGVLVSDLWADGNSVATDQIACRDCGRAHYRGPCPPVYCPPAPPPAPATSGAQPPAATQQAPTSPTTEAPATPAQPPAETFAPAEAPGTQVALGGAGASTPMLGRGDQSNRLNLFDTMSAIPRTRVWFSFQHLDDFNTDVEFTSAAGSPPFPGVPDKFEEIVTERRNERLYRFGFEYALSCDFSVAMQGQIFDHDLEGIGSGFNNPEIMFKKVVSRRPGRVVSAVLGLTPEVGSDRGEINEDATRLYPGMLFYQDLCPKVFLQGGFQFGIPVEGNQVNTADYGLSLGYWLYRHPTLDTRGCHANDRCRQPCILAVVPKIEIFGKHVLGDATVTEPFGLDFETVAGDDIFVYEETRHIIDMTIGGTVMCRDGLEVGAGLSFPLTGGNVREHEFLLTVGWNF